MTYIATLRRDYGHAAQQTMTVKLGVCNGMQDACKKAAVKAKKLQRAGHPAWSVFDVRSIY